MIDCRDFSDSELSLLVFNDEYLYKIRHRLTKDELEELGIKFTDDQWETFREDLADE